jgi:hypothetical protein
MNDAAGAFIGWGSVALANQAGVIRNQTGRVGLVVDTAQMLTVNGNGVYIGGNVAAAYRLQISQDSAAKPTTNTWTVSSDARIKKDIVDADLNICYENIKGLRLRRFEWDPEYYDQSITQDRHALGFIAQEVKEKFPKAVNIESEREFHLHQFDASGNILKDASGQEIVEIKKLENFHALNTDQIDKSHLGATQLLIKKVETLEARLAALEKLISQS